MSIFMTPKGIADAYINYITGTLIGTGSINYDTYASDQYYKYGNINFQTNEGVPPQIRIRPGRFTQEPTNKQTGYDVFDTFHSGCLSTIVTTMDCSIWGETEEQCLTEFKHMATAMKNSHYVLSASNDQDNPNITQPGYISIQGNIGSKSNHDDLGFLMNFQFQVKTNLPLIISDNDLALILSTSSDVSGSYIYQVTDTQTE